MNSKTEELQPILCCEELVKIYMSDGLKVMALQGLDLTIEQGEMVGIIGKSGSGKSTLLNIIGGLETPTAGRFLVDGRDLSAYTEKEMVKYRRSSIGFVWQKSGRNLLPYLSVQKNVEAPMYAEKMSQKEREARAVELLRMVGMEAHKDKLPDRLSGGEQQRVAIAVALANQPKILLADEPTGAVDQKNAEMILELFRKLQKELNLTILIVTHDMTLANKVERVVMIADGKISTEKIRKDAAGEDQPQASWGAGAEAREEQQEEYSVLDRAHRVQLREEVLEQAGIHSNRVKITVEGNKIMIEGEE